MDISMIRKTSTEVVPYNLDRLVTVYKAVKEAQDEVGGTFTFRAKLPKEGKNFLIDTGDEDNLVSVPSITGIVVHSHMCNAHFDAASRGDPPLCSSIDSKIGVDQNGETHDCLDCHWNKYGTAGEGKRGKACKNMIRLYIITEAAPVPLLLSLPPTSIRAWQTYRYGLSMDCLTPKDVITELTLKITASKSSGDKFATVKPRMVGLLSPEARQMAEMFASGFVPKVEISEEDYSEKEDGDVNESEE